MAKPIYAGLIYHARLDMTYEGEHEAIIDRDTFDRVQKMLNVDRNKRQGANRSRATGLLKGVAFCGCCGSVMRPTYTTANKGKYQSNERYAYYLCAKAAKHGYEHCEVKTFPQVELERVVVERLQILFQAPEMYAPIIRAAQDLRLSEIDKLEGEKLRIEIELGDVKDGKGGGIHDQSALLEKLNRTVEQLRAVRATHFQEQDLVASLKEFKTIWDHLSPSERQRVVQLMLEKVVVHANGVDSISIKMA